MPQPVDRYANVVLAIEGECWRMILPDGQAKMWHPVFDSSPFAGWVGTAGGPSKLLRKVDWSATPTLQLGPRTAAL